MSSKQLIWEICVCVRT